METQLTLNELMQKAEELKVVPFLTELIKIVIDLKPIIDNINRQIEDNVNKMPEATMKLKEVTKATEYATTEIMNTLDGIYTKIDQIKDDIGKIDSESNDLLKKNSLEKLDSMVEDNNAIMMVLQVQDITSQQIAAVNHLLNAMQKRLTTLLTSFHTAEIVQLISTYNEISGNGSEVEQMHREIAFDPNAIHAISHKDTRQQDIDDLINQLQSGEISEEDLNQKSDSSVNIDKENVEVDNENSSDDSGSDDDFANLSNEEIDALFGGSGDIASQDDIDKLFNT